MKKSVKIVISLVVVLLIATVIGVLYIFNSRVEKMNTVYYDQQFFSGTSENRKYEAGSTVELTFLLNYPNVKYDFNVVGVRKFDVNYDQEKGYVISFKMPYKYVSVYYQVAQPFEGIDISMDENPTTGFVWSYQILSDDIIKVVEDRYVSDDFGKNVIRDGVGGVHYWKFIVVSDGIVEIQFDRDRGDEHMDTLIYKYECANGVAKLLEIEKVEQDY